MELFFITLACFILVPIIRHIVDNHYHQIMNFFKLRDVLDPLSPKMVRLRMERNMRSDSMSLQNYILTAKTVADLIDLELDIHYFKTAYENIVNDKLLSVHTNTLEESFKMRMSYLHEKKMTSFRLIV